MKLISKNLAMAGATLLLSTFAMPASAVVIDFDDITLPGCCTFDPSYQGFTWDGASGAQSWVIAEESANIFGGTEAHSGANFAWSNGASDLSLSNGVFDLNSLWARSGGLDFTATAHGLFGGFEIFTQDFHVTQTYEEFTFNFSEIDTFTITNQATNILIDDICINDASCSAGSVPEPATYAMLGLGLLALGLRRRKQQA